MPDTAPSNKPVLMLYHGTPSREVINTVDLRHARMIEHGHGFYTRQQWHQDGVLPNGTPGSMTFNVESVAGWTDGRGGTVYRQEGVPEYMDLMSNRNSGRFLTSSAPVDDALINKITQGMRQLGKDPVSGRDFNAGADKLQKMWKEGKLNDYSTRDLVKHIQREFDVNNGKSVGKTSVDIFRESGIVGMHAQTASAVVILDPSALPPPKPHAIYMPNHPDANTVGTLLDRMNETQGLSQKDDLDIRRSIAQAAYDTEAGRTNAYDQIRNVRARLEASGVPLSDKMKEHLTKSENITGKLAGRTPEQIEADRKNPPKAAPTIDDVAKAAPQQTSMVLTPAEAAMKQAAQAQVDARPERIRGEGLDDYTRRVDTWHDKKNPNATRLEKLMFSSELCDVLTREAMLNANQMNGKQTYDAARIATPASQQLQPKSLSESLEILNQNYTSLRWIEERNKTLHSTSEYLQASGNARRAGHEVKAGGVGMPAETLHAGKLGRGAGLVGLGIGIMAAAGQAAAAEGRPTMMKDYAKAVYDQSPIAPALDGKYAEAGMRVVDMVDPTMGVATSGIRRDLRAKGVDVEGGLTDSIAQPTVAQKKELARNTNRSGFLYREQNGILQNAGLLDLKDNDGKRIDVAAILRDPLQRDTFIKRLEDTAAKATNADVKESINGMVAASKDFVAIEPERAALNNRNTQIMASLSADQQAASTPVAQAAEQRRTQSPQLGS